MANEGECDESYLSSQLYDSLHQSITNALSTRRPLLTHLNADTTWLLSLPCPKHFSSSLCRQYYYILIDPWFQGPQSDVASFFSLQWHAEPSSIQTIAELEQVIHNIETAAQGKGSPSNVSGDSGGTVVPASQINAVVISHEFTDHMHKDTLLEIASSVPIFATTKAASIIKSWKYFDSVVEIARFSGDWRSSSVIPLPEWIGISRIAYAGSDLLYYHSAIMICFPAAEGEEQAEGVIYTPHGISPTDLSPIATATPTVKTLALLHGLQDISLTGTQLNMGAHNGLQVKRLLGAKYWIGTHDEVKIGRGVVSWFLRRKIITLQEAVEQEWEVHGRPLKNSDLQGVDEVKFEALANGESMVLE